MQKLTHSCELTLRRSLLSIAVAGALLAPSAASIAAAPLTIHGVVAGSLFTPPVISNSPSSAKASSTVASVYQNAKVCFDVNDNAVCDTGEISTITNSKGAFQLSGNVSGPVIAEISTSATNNGNAVASKAVFRVAQAQISAATVNPLLPVKIAVTPLSTEVVRAIENDGVSYAAAVQTVANKLGVTNSQALSDPNTQTGTVQTALLTESTLLTTRWNLASKMLARGDVSTITAAEEAALNIEGIPRYDHIFIIMLENKGTNSIKGSPYAPKINNYLTTGNQFTTYYATGNPSEPNYTALGGADDFGISDDSQWNCDATGTNAVQDLPVPDKNQPGLANSPFATTCTQTVGVNHNIVSRPNLFNALTSNGLTWRTYSESMNPGQDFRTDSIADSSVSAPDHVYAPNTVNGNTSVIGSTTLSLGIPAGLYKTKHHPGMAYQNVRSAPEFHSSNRTLGGGQWDQALLASTKYTQPANYNVDQFSADLLSGDIGNLNYVIPDQCDDMHTISVTGTNSVSGGATTASDCSGTTNITRGDNYTDYIVQKIQNSPIWTNNNKRVAIVIMLDEGTGTYSSTNLYNGCCGWNPQNSTVANPLIQNPDGTFSVDSSIAHYANGNRGHGESIFGVLTNQAAAPKGQVDSDAYSHFSFVRTLQDMFGLADPANPGSYMNRSKYTEQFITANITNLPEYVSLTTPSGYYGDDLHFLSVRPMNHAYVKPSTYVQKQSTSDVSTPAQVGPDANQINLWAIK